jgi:hypothetical protein
VNVSRRFLLITALLFAQPVLGQTAAGGGSEWAFSATAFAYFVPEDADYILPVVAADRDHLHLEARYNYEAPDTASAWLGRTFGGGSEMEWEVTPILGIVLGDLEGVAPGYEGSLSWRALELYSEGEYLFDKAGAAGNFFYNWSELTVAPTEWLRFGLVTQRTRAYESDRDVQRGLLVGFSFARADLAAYVLNPDDDEPTVIVSVALEF